MGGVWVQSISARLHAWRCVTEDFRAWKFLQTENANWRKKVWSSYQFGFYCIFFGFVFCTPLHHPIRAPTGPKIPNSA